MIITKALIGHTNNHIFKSVALSQIPNLYENNCNIINEINKKMKLNKSVRPTMFAASFLESAIRMQLSYLPVANTTKIDVIEVNVVNKPKSAGLNILAKIGYKSNGKACAILVPNVRVIAFFTNSLFIGSLFNIFFTYKIFSKNLQYTS